MQHIWLYLQVFLYQGANAQPRPKDVLLGTEVVLNLLEKIPSGVSV